jgi:hypothetical protein
MIKQRFPLRFVRLERGVYPLSLVRPAEIALVRRLPSHMPTGLGLRPKRAPISNRPPANQGLPPPWAKACVITGGVVEAVNNVPISATLITNLSTSASRFSGKQSSHTP